MAAAITALTRGVELVYLYKRSPVPVSLVFKLINQLTPVGITNRLSQFRVFDHVFYAQTFTANHLVIVYQLSSQFVSKVSTTIGNFRLNASDFLTGFVEVGGALFLLTQDFLSLGKFGGILGSMARVSRFNAVRRNNKIGQTQIDAHGLIDHGQGFWLESTQARDKVTASAVSADGNCGGFAWEFTTPTHIKRLFALGNIKIATTVLKCRASKLGALIGALLFELGVFGVLGKEILERCLLMPQGLLQGNARDFIQPIKLRLFFKISKSTASGIVVDGLTIIVVSICAPFKDRVIHHANTAERPTKQFGLFGGWVKSVFVGSFFHGSQ